MSIYLKPILTACYLFPVLAALFTLPYMIHQYRKYGALLTLRVLIVYSFIFYMLTSYFMTILPLPPIDSVTPSSATMLLIPFDAVRRLADSSGFILRDPSTYKNVLLDMNFYQILFNILLLLPFGVYLRYYFNRKWYQVILLSFLYSLFFELTQLSGLYGIYPYPYRFFEVDDLICNTFGGLLGFWMTPIFSFFLPNREKLDAMSYQKGSHVSAYRRLMATMIDLVLIAIIYFAAFRISNIKGYLTKFTLHDKLLLFPLLVFLLMTIIMILTKGASIGKYLVNLKVKQENGSVPKLYQVFLRNIMIYLILLPGPFYVLELISKISQIQNFGMQFCAIMLVSILIVILLLFVLNLISKFIKRDSQYCYDRLLKIKLVSTIHHDESDSNIA